MAKSLPLRTQTSIPTLSQRSLGESLARRIAVETTAQRTGAPFRRHPNRIHLERFLVKPLLKCGLRAAGLYARGVRNALQPLVRSLSLRFPGLPAQFDGYRILHLADLHIDSVPGLPQAVSAALRDLDFDLCLMTGDYRFAIEGPCDAAYAGVDYLLSRLSPPDGTVAILGNHDPVEMAYGLDEMGVQVLVNDGVRLDRGNESIWLAGLDDPYDYCCDDLGAAIESIPPDSFTILLAHTPDLYSEAAAAGIDLYLCGHTHAGQVRLPFIGSVIQNSDAPRAYTHGYWQHDGMQAYTSAGVGCSMLPIRFNCPPEIVLIELKRAR